MTKSLVPAPEAPSSCCMALYHLYDPYDGPESTALPDLGYMDLDLDLQTWKQSCGPGQDDPGWDTGAGPGVGSGGGGPKGAASGHDLAKALVGSAPAAWVSVTPMTGKVHAVFCPYFQPKKASWRFLEGDLYDMPPQAFSCRCLQHTGLKTKA